MFQMPVGSRRENRSGSFSSWSDKGLEKTFICMALMQRML